MEEASARYISIHAPREGGDRIIRGVDKFTIRFQSTPPARGATGVLGVCGLVVAISIHAPREGGDGLHH